MARKVFEISFNIAGKVNNTFRAAFSSAARELDRLKEVSKEVRTSLKDLEKQYKSGAISAEQYRTTHQKLTQQLEKLERTQERINRLERQQQLLRQKNSELAGQLATTTAMAAPFALAVRSAVQFEDAMLGVAKQVEGARDESGKLTAVYYEMAEQIKALGREIPIPTTEIAAMVEAGARMGIPREHLIGFTREVAKMSTAFEMSADVVADQMGKIANVMQIPIENIRDLADTINYLDDNSVSKGPDIIEVLQRIGGTAKQIGMDAHQAAALGSTFLSLGKRAEVAANAANALMRELVIAEQQPDRFQKGLEMLGMTAKEVNKGMVKDAQGTILRVLEAINKLEKERQTEATTLLFGKEYGDDVAALAGAINEYKRQIEMLNDAQRVGSIDREYEARLQSTSAQFELLKNSAMELGVNIGTVLLPPLNELVKNLADLSQKVADFSKEYPGLTKAIVLGSAGLLTASAAWIGLRLAINSVRLAATGVKKFLATGEAGAATKSARKTTKKVSGGGKTPKTGGKLSLGKVAGAGGKLAGRATLPLMLASEIASIAMSNDKTKATAQAAGGAGGGLAGAKMGALIGSAIAPGIGTAIGGFLGGTAGYLVGRWAGGRATDLARQGAPAQSEVVKKQEEFERKLTETSNKLTNTQQSVVRLQGSFDDMTKKLQQAQGGIGTTIIHLNYSPNVNVQNQEISSILRQDKDDLMRRLEQLNHQRRRVAYSGG